MGWNDVREEANKPQESRYLNLNDGDKLTLQIIGQPTLNSRVSKRTGDPFKVVVFQVLEPRSEKAKTLELFLHRSSNSQTYRTRTRRPSGTTSSSASAAMSPGRR